MKKTILMLLGIVLFTSCKKEEEEQTDPCAPYTFNLEDGDVFNMRQISSYQFVNGTLDSYNVQATYSGCFTDSGTVSSSSQPFSRTQGFVRVNDTLLDLDDGFIQYTIKSEGSKSLEAESKGFNGDLFLIITKD